PYNGFSTDTISSTNGSPFIETVKQAFTPGNLVVLQRGEGSVALGSSAYMTFLDEYTPTGTLVQRIAMPVTDSGSQHALDLPGQQSGQGLINRSANGYYIPLGGYDALLGRTFLTSTFPYTILRTIGRVDGSANVDTSTAIGIANSTGAASTITAATAT